MPSVAVVGATGAVGELMRQVLIERKFPFKRIKFLASPKSAGKTLTFDGTTYPIEPISAEAFDGVDLVLSSTPASISREYSPIAASAGAIVVDNSSAWRMDPDVPLVVPEVNADALLQIRKGIVANPNCSTIQMVVALKPLHDFAGIKRVIVSTYQASSGKGATGLNDLDAQISAIGKGEPVPAHTAHVARLAGNVLAHDWKLGEEGYTEEEWKMIKETRKIMGDETIQVSPTCVRVPVRIGHSEAVNVEFHRPITVQQARELLAKAPGVVLLDNPAQGEVPQPLHCEGQDHTYVGRIRPDHSVPHGLNLWVVADNLRKGAATNAVQIAQELLNRGLLGRR
ncbi:aspartate-semialdehyde dehydrogenase [Tuwongella immobilis]|uniref:Aspartate-semialdehyde dehydrogenase n=1 Tax=Tuwongella immobilis TaxID=692036 RepID=A0A6C2YNX6_9BACT|nr:aspartate-semialdehyde dehydrogenase [Tuwongella immobilis]VIP02899.1 aspartate-semialdehyde dehydrogenase : Aspartate-semialdehyde dehydrogenase OS=Singulisphaera acidiphila (strain ATCC BAA-1392 / DSM 18658 / VKM B-2454 / MOB10) GN=asd PE=3 SV=1: Semialdhyde_dh: Semialdhyde_dhC [Tuwongella immobilis]VTS02785.1 aspartate-semialdehyde dehydrogenase : Aspartate-semialdehyde dehydrogenase OS=Singulisphaera acidiphila (strain ATCC BAA-1392 / DSM 18658 / VKM B-2454 / MOB10) GN=asd PE=3 SV=1: Semia